ncbi:MAG: ATP-binding protein [Tepidiformaceae bacterium]
MNVVQMHGEPGSGKSTLARAMGQALPAIVIDKDSIASAMIRSGIDRLAASGAAYEAMRGLAADFLRAGHSVVLDSPCYWPEIEERGRALAQEFGAGWAMVEVHCSVEQVECRLVARAPREGQPTNRDSVTPRQGMYSVSCERLVLDSTRSVAEMVEEAVTYVWSLTPRPPLPLRRERGSVESIAAQGSGLG